MSHRRRSWLLFIPLILGVVVVVLLVGNRQPPTQHPPTETAQPVRTLEVPAVAVVPRARGYGEVQPSTVWEAVAEVSGRVIERHPELERGRILPADTVVLRLDPTDYQLAVAQIEAQLAQVQAQQREIDQQEANAEASLDIERDALALSRAEQERLERLRARGNVTASELDAERRNVLSQRQRVQELENQLALYPVQRQLLSADLQRLQAQLDTAQRDLTRTEIRLPIRGRISQAPVERFQYVRQGDLLAAADGLEVAEIETQIPIESLRPLIQAAGEAPQSISTDGGRRLLARLRAQVELRLGNAPPVTWPGRVTRITDTIDPQSRTVGVVVGVDQPYATLEPGVRPPLVKGLFVAVELQAPPLPPPPQVTPTADWNKPGKLVEDHQRRCNRPLV
ncbi:MAG: efflux RND transporter periplasmic adaptor subunit, partial [Candidatus Competibacterales bacterium]